MPDRLCLYVRPSLDSSVEEQLAALRAWSQRTGHEIVREVVEPPRKRGPDHRREGARMLADGNRGHWDRLVCTSLATLCRSVTHAHETLSALDTLGLTLTALHDGIDTATDAGRTLAAFALAGSLEHAVHVERATVGARRRIEAGFQHGRPRIPASTEMRIVNLIRAGTSTERITRIVGCSHSTVTRVRKELQPAP